MKNNRMRNQIIIILTTFVVGLFNTLLLKPEDTGTWKNYVGYGFLLICLINVFWFLILIGKKSTK